MVTVCTFLQNITNIFVLKTETLTESLNSSLPERMMSFADNVLNIIHFI